MNVSWRISICDAVVTDHSSSWCKSYTTPIFLRFSISSGYALPASTILINMIRETVCVFLVVFRTKQIWPNETRRRYVWIHSERCLIFIQYTKRQMERIENIAFYFIERESKASIIYTTFETFSTISKRTAARLT